LLLFFLESSELGLVCSFLSYQQQPSSLLPSFLPVYSFGYLSFGRAQGAMWTT
jgi:hypothetical protein